MAVSVAADRTGSRQDLSPELRVIREARLILQSEFKHRPAIYWADLLLTVAVGYACAAWYLGSEGVWQRVVAFVVAGLALFRAGTFIHEIAHMGQRTMRGFKAFWNLSVGVPLLMPSFLYDCHIDHHAVPHYGTEKDGEYLPLRGGPMTGLVLYLAQVLVIPLLAVVRFGVLCPVSFLHPRLRQWTLERASSYVMNPWYRRTIPASAARRWWALLDVLCCVRTWMIFVLIGLGINHWTRMIELYALACYVIGLNWTRNLVAHRYVAHDGPLSHLGQLMDSITIAGRGVLTELLFPLGLRYHALHHLFPGIPYHELGSAHRKLMAQLPPDSPYRQTVRPSFWSALRELIHDMQQAQRAQHMRAAAA
jgi:fatty acid desaturase